MKKKKSPYARFDRESLILRDVLAVDRTVMANTRTFLSYIRTSLTLFIAGVTFIHFFEPRVFLVIGWSFIPISGVVFVLGTIYYIRMKRSMKHIQ
jgi:putative membrane protein